MHLLKVLVSFGEGVSRKEVSMPEYIFSGKYEESCFQDIDGKTEDLVGSKRPDLNIERTFTAKNDAAAVKYVKDVFACGGMITSHFRNPRLQKIVVHQVTKLIPIE